MEYFILYWMENGFNFICKFFFKRKQFSVLIEKKRETTQLKLKFCKNEVFRLWTLAFVLPDYIFFGSFLEMI